MPDPLLKPIREQIADQVEREIQLEADEKAAIAVDATNTGGRIGVAVDLGKGFEVGGHVEVAKGKKPGWFAGLKKSWKK
jgi:hypothetical protein